MNGATKCEKHRTIGLMSHITKLVLRIVINIIRGRTLQEVSPEQYGFMLDKGTKNAIFVVKRLVERSVEKKEDVYTCFIDYSKAFDTVKHDSLVELPTNLSTTLHRRRTTVTQHQSQCQQHGPLSEPALIVTSINIEGMSAAKQQLLTELCEKQKCDVLCVQETHRGLKAIRPNIRGMSLLSEIPHEQYGSAIFVRNNCISTVKYQKRLTPLLVIVQERVTTVQFC